MKLQRALKDWLLDRLEDKTLWFTAQGTPLMLSVAELAGRMEKDLEFITALDLWAVRRMRPSPTPSSSSLPTKQCRTSRLCATRNPVCGSARSGSAYGTSSVMRTPV